MTKPSSANLPINIDTDASSAEILAALQILLFLVTVKLPSYTSADLLDFHSPLVPQILAIHLTSSLFQNLSKCNSIQIQSINRSLVFRGSILKKSLRGVLFIVRAGSDIIKTDFMHTKRTNFPTKMKIGIHLEELK